MITRYLISTICIALLLWGCDNTTAAMAKPNVVRKKIVARKDNTAKVRPQKTARGLEREPAAKQQTRTLVANVGKTQVEVKNQPVANKETGARSVIVKKIEYKPVQKTKTVVAKVDKAQAEVKNPPVANKETGARSVIVKKIEYKAVQKTKTVVAKVDKNQADAKIQLSAKRDTDSRRLITENVETQPFQNKQPNPIKQKKPAISPKSEITEIKLAIKNQEQPGDGITVTGEKLKVSNSVAASNMQPVSIPAMYNPTGKIDPFEPLFKEKPLIAKERKQLKRVPRTPLERIDLSQLKLVGIILASSGNRALVEESSGKGYVIKKGTYIGTNGGKIVKINKEIVTVEEKFEDVFGKIQTRQREIKLPKPPGEF